MIDYKTLIDILYNSNTFLLFETGLKDADNYQNFLFYNPIDIIIANSYKDLPKLFDKIEEYRKRYYLAGYLNYETGYILEDDLNKNFHQTQKPIIKFGVFEEKNIIKFDNINYKITPLIVSDYHIDNTDIKIKKNEYIDIIKKIKKHIYDGDTYQVNFSFKVDFDFWGSPYLLYQQLLSNQPVSYAAFMKFNSNYILSLSPELFFKISDSYICSKPMKGTLKRGINAEEDEKKLNFLKNDIKNRAENTMIIDLIRNDFGRICIPQTVRVQNLFKIEKYKTLFQMTSTVEGKLKDKITFEKIFSSIFPCGSVTGAPKISSMKIINKYENFNRNIYCGAIGYISPYGDAQFNVPIRTININNNKGNIYLGSGIVSDSNPEDEYNECLLKGQFFFNIKKEFNLIESLKWDNGYYLFDKHINRLQHSAEFFSFKLDLNKVIKALTEYENKLNNNKTYKIRLLLEPEGNFSINNSIITTTYTNKKTKICFSKYKTDPDNIYLYHKTTNRDLYNNELIKARKQGCYEIIFENISGYITEGATTNIIYKKNNYYFSPKLSHGLLKGTYLEKFFENNNVIFTDVTRKDLTNADDIYLLNSVRGLIRVDEIITNPPR